MNCEADEEALAVAYRIDIRMADIFPVSDETGVSFWDVESENVNVGVMRPSSAIELVVVADILAGGCGLIVLLAGSDTVAENIGERIVESARDASFVCVLQ